jgi:chemotaxis protein MotB
MEGACFMGCVTTLRRLAMLGIVATVTVGCTPQDRYDNLLTANRSTEEQLVTVEQDRDAAVASRDAMRRQLDQARAELNTLRSQHDAVTGEMRTLADDYESLLNRTASIEMGPLPAEVEAALMRLAKEHPDLLTLDSKRGMLRFASDFTFAMGSVELKPDALSTLQQLASILNSGKATSLEVRVVGHTDSVPVSNPQTRQRHPNNVYLSAHRAISVRDALTQSGVEPVRIQVAGYGEYRPIVPSNPDPKVGTPENRRVEIFLVPMPQIDAETPRTSQPSTDPTTTASEPTYDEPMK